MENQDGSGRQELPVWETIKESVIFPLTHLRALVRLGWPLALVEGAMTLIYTPLNYHLVNKEMQKAPSAWPILIGFLIQGAVTISWSVAWIRSVLESNDSAVKLRFGRREWKYAGVMVGLMVGAVVLFVVLFAALTIAAAMVMRAVFSGAGGTPSHLRVLIPILAIGAILGAAGSVVWVRLMLIFPAIAADEYRGLRGSWQDTRGNFWRISAIMFALMLLGWLFALPFIGAMFLSYRVALIVGGIIGCTVAVVISAFIHTAWALIYRRLTPEAPQPMAAAQAG